MNFNEAEFVIVDVETTGLSPVLGHRVIEIAALRVRNLKPAEQFYSLINPGREIPFGAFYVNGISSEMLKDAPGFEEICSKFFEFLGNDIIVGHNIKFDLKFLYHEAMWAGFSFKKESPALCTVKMARGLLPELRRYPLWYVAHSLGFEISQLHRAMADVELTFAVFKKLLAVADRRDIWDLTTLMSLFGNKKA